MGVHSTGLPALHRSCACGVPQRQKGEGPALRTGQRVSLKTSLIIARRTMSQAPSETRLPARGVAARIRVLDVVPFEAEDDSPFVGLLQVDAA